MTATALALEKEDLKEGMQISTVQIGKPEHTAAGGGKPRVYKTKAKVNGKKVQKFAKEYTTPRGERPTMGFFLEKANKETREAVLGKRNSDRFYTMTHGDGKVDANEALRRIIANPTNGKRRRRR